MFYLKRLAKTPDLQSNFANAEYIILLAGEYPVGIPGLSIPLNV